MPRTSDRRERIVALARKTFTANGYDATSIGALATELEISKAAIAYYFPTKDTFLNELVTPFLDELEEAVAAAQTPEQVMTSYLDVLKENQDIAVWVDTDPAVQASEAHGGRLSAINEAAMAKLVGTDGSDADRALAWGLLGGVWRPVRELGSDELEAHSEDIVTVALAGLDV